MISTPSSGLPEKRHRLPVSGLLHSSANPSFLGEEKSDQLRDHACHFLCRTRLVEP